MTTTALVSVVVAARNEAERISRALRSIQQQTYDRWELLVVDDASTDATVEQVRALEDPRIRLLRAPERLGRGAARNLALAHARGDWIAVQDADDVSEPDRLARLVARAEQPDRPVAVSGQATCVTPAGRTWRLRRYPEDDDDIKAELAAGSMAVCHAACLIRRDALLRISGYDPTCLRAQDLNLFLRLLPLGRLAAVPEVLVRYEHPVLLPYGYWRTSSRFADLARRRARYGSDWQLAPRPGAAVTAPPRSLEHLRYGAHLALRAGRYLQQNGPGRG